ncbi:MAG: LemA family protein, partial [Bacteroidaceae bacterium]|nr:LemA family protein [Bacteroidaceae bacterium]
MKKSTIIIIAVAVLAVVWGITGYNGLVSMDEG